jgi:hypothetical protein
MIGKDECRERHALCCRDDDEPSFHVETNPSYPQPAASLDGDPS